MASKTNSQNASNTAASDKPKRVMPTAEERVAALEAKLAKAREAAERKAGAGEAKLRERRESLVQRIAKLQEQLAEVDAQLPTPVEDEGDEGTTTES